MDSKNSKIKRPKRQQKVIEDYWDCSVCTFRNTAEAFKCLMCDVRKGKSRHTRWNWETFTRKMKLRGGSERHEPSCRHSVGQFAPENPKEETVQQLQTRRKIFSRCVGARRDEEQKSIILGSWLAANLKLNPETYFHVFLGTSTRKPRLNSALVSAQQIQLPGSSNPHGSKSSNKHSRGKNKRSKYVRLKNIDRTTGQTREVTVNNLTVVITEYKKIVNNRESRNDSSDYSESNDSRS